jgi:Zn-dependent protease with chaperone function
MKKALVYLLLALPFTIYAQLTFELKGVISKKISSTLLVGKNIELKSIYGFEGFYEAKISSEGKEENIDFKHLNRITFNPASLREFWQLQGIKTGAYENIFRSGFQYKLRKEIDDEALEYLSYIETNNLIFEDSYLESYLYSLIYKIYPDRLNDGRPGILNVHVIKDLLPNAFIFPNGSLFISTGLLSTIHSEEELIGVLAHEVSHFVLDHSLININKATARQKRAEFWAAVATAVAATAEIYAANHNQYYAPGAFTMSTAILAFGIAESVSIRFGLQYSREQEFEADNCANELMKFIKVNPLALSSALLKIKRYCVKTGNYLALTGEGTHPSLNDRINSIGMPPLFKDDKYDRVISFVNTFNAILEFNNQHFSSCSTLLERNVAANVAIEEDYLMLAMVNIYMFDNEEKNMEALKYINVAKQISVFPTINQPKQEAIVLIRLKKFEEAKNCLLKYNDLLSKESSSLDKNNGNNSKEILLRSYLNREYEWSKKMINKVNKL